MSSLPEALLARLTTPDRAAAIYGDITELAASRSRLWFWTTYIRAMISLGWRTPAAFVVAFACVFFFKPFAGLIFPKLILFALWIHHPGFIVFGHDPYVFLSTHAYIQQAIVYSASQLWFLAPFAIARYGFGDRLARLALALLLMTIGMMLSIPFLSPLLAVASIIAIGASFVSPGWRRAAVSVIAITALGVLTFINLGRLPYKAAFALTLAFHNHIVGAMVWNAIQLMPNMLVVAIVCPYIYKLRFRKLPAIA